MNPTPTREIYGMLESAYEYFNSTLFGGTLPHCLITFQRKRRARGYFSPGRFEREGVHVETTDEIALNPSYFKDRSQRMILSTLAHEMVHLWQFHYGNPSRKTYHNKEWAERMRLIGLIPSHTGKPGGRQTGQKMTHYIEPRGPFDEAYSTWVAFRGEEALYQDRDMDLKDRTKTDRTKYMCAKCKIAVWGKPGLNVICGTCQCVLSPATPPDLALLILPVDVNKSAETGE